MHTPFSFFLPVPFAWRLRCVAVVLAAALVAACGGGDASSTGTARSTKESSDTPAINGQPPARAAGAGAAQGDAGIFIDRLDPGETLTGLRICAGGYVDSIQLLTVRIPARVRRGGGGGTCHDLTLGAGESIRRVFGSGQAVIDSLGVETTAGRLFGPFGNPAGGRVFSMSTAGTFRGLSGADGRFDSYLLLAQINLIDDFTGGNGGTDFVDRLQPDETVTAVTLCYRETYVLSVRLRTSAGLRPRHGAYLQDAPCSEEKLASGEYITEIFGRAGQYVNSLGYVTSLGRRIGPFPANMTAGTEFNQSITRGRFAGWYGRSAGWLDRIGLVTDPVVSDLAVTLQNDKKLQRFTDPLPEGQFIQRVQVCTFMHPQYQSRVVSSVRAFTAQGALPLNGGRDQKNCESIEFEPGEFITEMYGRYGGAIDSIGLRTSTGRDTGLKGGPGGNRDYLLRNPATSRFFGFAGRYRFDGELMELDFAAPDLYAAESPPVAVAAKQGWWDSVADWPINAIHASVLGNGRVLTYGTEGGGAQGAFVYDVWDPAQGVAAMAHQTLDNTLGTDIFCGAQTLFPNGSVLIAGGDDRRTQSATYDGFNKGVTDVNVFEPSTNKLVKTVPMSNPRWYATQTMLPSGRVLVTGGRNKESNDYYVAEPELYTPGQGWKKLSSASSPKLATYYPRVFVAPRAVASTTDEVYIIPTGGRTISLMSIAADGRASIETFKDVELPGVHDWQRPAVMFAPGKLLLHVTHNTGDGNSNGKATLIVQLPRSAADKPSVMAGPPLNEQRYWSSFTMLPNGDVLATGGAKGDTQMDPLNAVSKAAYLWTPGAAAWRPAAEERRPRLYHSTAVLLPDGRVLSAGGGSPGPVLNLNAQLYSPPYLFRAGGNGEAATRPVILSAPATLPYGSAEFTLNTQGSKVTTVTLVRLGSTTHSFDFDARFVPLTIKDNATPGVVKVAGPDNRFTAPPGKYLLTVLDASGVPSKSSIVTLNN